MSASTSSARLCRPLLSSSANLTARCPRSLRPYHVPASPSSLPPSARRSQARVALPQARRTFTISHARQAALATHPPAQATVLLAYPSPSAVHKADEDADEDEPEVDFVPPEEAKIEITKRAAEQLRSIAAREKNPDAALRIAVESGGCHGYQYKMELAKSREPDDYHFSHPTVKPSNILVDAVSMALLKDSTIDFATELIGSSFRVVDNPQVNSRSLRLPLRTEMCTLLSEDKHVSTLLAFIYLFLARLTYPANAQSCYNHVITS
ncbi:hypothetical protein AcW1_003862 [Taiwanofungus camphoratus]|nr:hypothetical protein AcW1_003862 [Antrodia cinnamomea]